MRWPVRTLAERFWSKVRILGENECWPWLAGVSGGTGYGYFAMPRQGMKAAHRVAWALTFGTIQSRLFVLHRCDNPPCVNPAHLFLGTQQQNIDDMRIKGRQACFNDGSRRGEKNAHAKVTREQVEWMRSHYVPRSSEFSAVALARRFGLSPRYAVRLLNGRTWKERAA